LRIEQFSIKVAYSCWAIDVFPLLTTARETPGSPRQPEQEKIPSKVPPLHPPQDTQIPMEPEKIPQLHIAISTRKELAPPLEKSWSKKQVGNYRCRYRVNASNVAKSLFCVVSTWGVLRGGVSGMLNSFLLAN